jgi:hypothetical protein
LEQYCECDFDDNYSGQTNRDPHENSGNDENNGDTLSGDSNPTTGVGFSTSAVVAAFVVVFAAKKRKISR